jgi:hypothetical protein
VIEELNTAAEHQLSTDDSDTSIAMHAHYSE